MKDNMTIREWVEEAHNNAVEHGWYDRQHHFAEDLMLINSELVEALQEYRKGNSVNLIYSQDGKPEGIPMELADVAIRLFDICGYYEIDLESAVKYKHEFNKTRPYRHGDKKL